MSIAEKPDQRKLSDIPANATRSEKARVRLRIVEALQPFNLPVSQVRRITTALGDEPFFYRSSDEAAIYKFYTNVHELATKLAAKLNYQKDSGEENELVSAYTKAALAHPRLLSMQPNTIMCNIASEGTVQGEERVGVTIQLAHKLGYAQDSSEAKQLLADYVKAALLRPELFYLDPNTIMSNLIGEGQVKGERRAGIVTQLSQKLGYSPHSQEESNLLGKYVRAALMQPQLFYQHPDTAYQKITQLLKYAEKLHEKGLTFPNPLPREMQAGLSGDALIISRLLNSPALLANGKEVYELGLLHTLNKYESRGAAVPFSAMVQNKGAMEAELIKVLGGTANEPTAKTHPDKGDVAWTKADAQNWLLRALARSQLVTKTSLAERKPTDQAQGPVL